MAGRQLRGQGAGQADKGGLGGGIGHLAAGAALAPDGGDVHDAALMGVEHGGQHRAAGVERSVYVHGEKLVPALVRQLLKQGLACDASVVHQQGHGAEGLLHPTHHGLHLLPLRHVRLTRHHPTALGGQLRRQLLGLVLPHAVADANRPAPTRQLCGHGSPDASGRPCDQCDLLHIFRPPPVDLLNSIANFTFTRKKTD